MTSIYKILSTVILCAILTSCTTTNKFVYPHDMRELIKVADQPVYDKTVVAILPFNDNRNTSESVGAMPMGLVPPVPFGWCYYPTPEAARYFATIQYFLCTPTNDLANAFYTSLKHSNLFNDVFFAYGGINVNNADIIITGTINEFSYKGKIFSYCISVYGPFLWILGVPSGYSYNKVDVVLQANKPQSDKVLWEYTITGDGSYVQGIYYNYGYDIVDFSKIIQEGYNEAILDLQMKIKENPEAFK